MDLPKLRAWWWHRQGFDGRFTGKTEAEVLAATGWMRSVGGSGPYLGLFERCGASRASVDAAISCQAIHELPSARGCTYVLPAADFALGLRVGQGFADGNMSAARKLGVTDVEVDDLALKILAALKSGPLEPGAIKRSVGDAARSLGEAGKKKGVSSTLPLALGRLQAAGEIRRIPTNGRLDQQRYRYARWQPNPLKSVRLTDAQAATELARRFFQWIAPATLAEFQGFSGFGVKTSNEAVLPLELQPLEPDSPFLTPPALREPFEAFRTPKAAHYALPSCLDGLLLLRRDLKTLMAEEDLTKPVAGEDGCTAGGGLMDLPNNAIVDRGRIVGVWEYDPGSQEIVWSSFHKPNPAMKAAIARMEKFVREQLGDARSFSLDSPKSRASRLKGLRSLATW